MTDLETKLNYLLRKLNIPLRAVWIPDPKSEQHAKIDLDNGLILIYDEDEDSAIFSFMHEILEYRISHLTTTYRKIINSLIELIEQLIYREKEEVLEQLLVDFKIFAENRFL